MVIRLQFLLTLAGVLVSPAAGIAMELQNVLQNTHRGNEYGYPTDFTRGVMPIPVHSHNDYWRDIPFYTGLSKGCMSTEADVWLYDGTLYVGHDQSALTEERTLESLYIYPMLEVLKLQNPESRFVPEPTKHGVFDTDRNQTLYFFIDAKTSGPETFKAIISALEPLRKEGFLTTVKDNEIVTNGAITIIGTGNTPYDMVGPVVDRDYFFDANLETLDDPENQDITSVISPIASGQFTRAMGSIAPEADPILNDKQMSTLRAQIATAKERGIGARYWDTPYFPVRTRNLVWRTLLHEGVALLNADDLDSVVDYF